MEDVLGGEDVLGEILGRFFCFCFVFFFVKKREEEFGNLRVFLGSNLMGRSFGWFRLGFSSHKAQEVYSVGVWRFCFPPFSFGTCGLTRSSKWGFPGKRGIWSLNHTLPETKPRAWSFIRSDR